MSPVPPACRVFPFETADGPANMARDEALLDLVAADPSAAAFRAYAWSVPTLSLGYFQSASAAEADPRWRGLPLVRRPTGGGALWHDREVTYALVVPPDHPLARRSTDLYAAVHSAIAALLNATGFAASRRGPDPGPDGPRPFLCFQDRDPSDLVLGSHKVVGSAQRRRSGAVLQHGSVLLGRSPVTPELPGLDDLGPGSGSAEDWAGRLAAAVTASLGYTTRPEPWPPALRSLAATLEAQTYRSPAWTSRR